MVSHVKAKLRMRAYNATGSGERKVSRKYNSICFSIFIHKTVPSEPRLDSVSTEPAIPIRIRTLERVVHQIAKHTGLTKT